MIRDDIAGLVCRAVEKAQDAGTLPKAAIPDVVVEEPANPNHGDYASNLPMRLARAMGMNPIAIGERILAQVEPGHFVAKVDLAPPGFLNFVLGDSWLCQQVEAIIDAGPTFGSVDLGRGQRIQVEFGSANPTGPLTVAFGRGGALGDALANLLAKAGYSASREYYVNDAGTRMQAFYETALARYQQAFAIHAEIPAEGYHGAYMIDLGAQLAAEYGDRFLRMPKEEALPTLGKIALHGMVAAAKSDLDIMGVKYDVWFYEQSLFDRGLVNEVLGMLDRKGYIDRREGAVWFASSALGEDKDNVLVRSNGIPTYFASDIAYHYDKMVLRCFDRVIDIWGADHQGHVPRMHAGMTALDIAPARLTIIIHQMITLRRGKEIVRMSKRTGDLITLREVLDEVGPDACRFFFLARSADSQMDFDLELAKEQSEKNPVYYVQYAHARIASILEYAGEVDLAGADVCLLRSDPELALIRKMLRYPELVETAAKRLEPHVFPYYAQDLATVFHSFYKQCRVVSDDVELTKARLKLVQAAKLVLANVLGLMGVSTPDKM